MLSLQPSTKYQDKDKCGHQTPTYISIMPKKDGTTATVKRLNLMRSSSNSSLLPLRRRLHRSASNFSFFKFTMSNSIKSSSNSVSSRSIHSNDSVVLYVRHKMQLSLLPAEIISHIIYFLDYKSIQKFSRTCKRIYSICHEDYLWHKLLQADFHSSKNTEEDNNMLYRSKSESDISAKFNPIKLYQSYLLLRQRWLTGKVEIAFLRGHTDSIYCLEWIGKNYLISGSRDNTLRLWYIPTAQCVRVITEGHSGSILCLKVDQKKKYILSGSSDATCVLWSLPEIEPVLRIRGHGHAILGVCFMRNKMISCSRDQTIKVWDKNTGKQINELIGHHSAVNAVECIDDVRVASASSDDTIKIWNIETRECLRTIEADQLAIECIRYDGRFLYSGGIRGRVKVWDTTTGDCVRTLVGHAGTIRSIDYSEGKLVTGSYDRTIKVWDTSTGSCVLSFQSGHSDKIFAVLLSGTHIISSGKEKRIMVLDFGNGLHPLCK
ncbi:WD40-repeat-containing domain protein [Pilobolus umbonatus]|nr:WD40-repeat-containing domain protein [Pilobolus umbonatus]